MVNVSNVTLMTTTVSRLQRHPQVNWNDQCPLMADCWFRTAHRHRMRLLHRLPITNQCPFRGTVCFCIQQAH
eukprot:8988384-Heterocapsa_arctica.AAC.1